MILVCFLALLILGVEAVIRGNTTCEGYMHIYADGVHIITHGEYNIAAPFEIEDETQVLGVYCSDGDGVAGIILALDNGIKTDTSWKCSSTNQSYWKTPCFDDSNWDNGVITSTTTTPQELQGKADWIWSTAPTPGEAYCRKKLLKLENSMTTINDCQGCCTSDSVLESSYASDSVLESSYASDSVLESINPIIPTHFITVTETVSVSPISYTVTEQGDSNMSDLNSNGILISSSQPFEFQSTQPVNCPNSSPPFFIVNEAGNPQLMSRTCRDVIVVTDIVAEATEARSSIIKELTVSKKNLTVVVNKKISAEDSRTSAKAVGYVGIVFFLLPIMIIIMGDVPYLLQLRHHMDQGN